LPNVNIVLQLWSKNCTEMQYQAILCTLHNNVLWLKITVDDTTGMQVLNSSRNVMHNVTNLTFRQTATVLRSQQHLMSVKSAKFNVKN